MNKLLCDLCAKEMIEAHAKIVAQNTQDMHLCADCYGRVKQFITDENMKHRTKPSKSKVESFLEGAKKGVDGFLKFAIGEH